MLPPASGGDPEDREARRTRPSRLARLGLPRVTIPRKKEPSRFRFVWAPVAALVIGGLLAAVLLVSLGGSSGPAIRPWPDATLPADVTTTVQPAESNDVLINPGKGWVVYTDVSLKSPQVWDLAAVCYGRWQ